MDTNAAGQGPVAPWSDEDIIARYHRAFGKFPNVYKMAMLRWIRDDWATDRAALAKRIDDYLATISAMATALEQPDSYWRTMFLEMRDKAVAATEYRLSTIRALEAQQARLQQQLAERGEWEPLTDEICNTDGHEVLYVKDGLLSIVGEYYVYLPDELRLCRRKPSGGEVTP